MMLVDNGIFVAALAMIVISAWAGAQGFFRRTLSVFAVVCGATLLVALMLRLVPGDPIDAILGEQSTSEAREAMAKELGIVDEDGQKMSLPRQYGHMVRGMLSGDFKSYRSRQPVFKLIAGRFHYSASLALAAMCIAILIGIPLGALAAIRKGKWLDAMLMTFAAFLVSIPRIWLAPMLLLLFAIELSWLPVSGADDGLRSLILPAFSLGLALCAVLAKHTRGAIIDVLSEDFVRTAHSKGLPERVVLFKHALRNALIPVTTLVGLQLASILAGTVVIEKVFVWPGIGLLLIEAIQTLDMPVVQGVVLTISFIYVFANWMTDLAYAAVDPRVGKLVGGSSR
jgi:peptide/nickel transport system permease protein